LVLSLHNSFSSSFFPIFNEVKMGWTCSSNVGNQNFLETFNVKYHRKNTLRRPQKRWEYNVKIHRPIQYCLHE
jgi:hypothetical protein